MCAVEPVEEPVFHASQSQVLGHVKPEFVTPPKVPIRDKIRRVQLALRTQGRARFFDLLAEAQSRVEIMVTFLAILELVKQRRVAAFQEKVFGDILVEPLGDWVNDDSIQIYSDMEPLETLDEDGPAATPEESDLS